MACNGQIIPNTPIAVDFWYTRKAPTARIFFLSHMHADHTAGLTPSWSAGEIYCSPISKKLLIHKLKIPESIIHSLEVNESHIVYLDRKQEVTMTVSVIDANHCPGSVMFLFQGYFGSILYTGDFRYSPEMFVDTPLACSPHVDVLYLDNTYCTPKSSFPSRDEAKEMISQIILENVDKEVAIGIRTLGKESLLEDLAVEFKTRVIVSQETYDILELLEAKDVFSVNPDDGFIHAVPFNKLNGKFLRKFNPGNEEKFNELVLEDGKWVSKLDIVGILPTALYVGLDSQPHAKCKEMHIVPYSDHSSYLELLDFVRQVKPGVVHPVVPASSKGVFNTSLKDRADMSCFNGLLSGEPLPDFSIPMSVKQWMEIGGASISTRASIEKKIVPAPPFRHHKKDPPKQILFSDSPDKEPRVRLKDIATKSVGRELIKSAKNNGSSADSNTDDGKCTTCLAEFENNNKPDQATRLRETEDGATIVDSTPLSCDDTQSAYVSPNESYRFEVNAHNKNKRRKLPLTFTSEQAKQSTKKATITDFFKKERKENLKDDSLCVVSSTTPERNSKNEPTSFNDPAIPDTAREDREDLVEIECLPSDSSGNSVSLLLDPQCSKTVNPTSPNPTSSTGVASAASSRSCVSPSSTRAAPIDIILPVLVRVATNKMRLETPVYLPQKRIYNLKKRHKKKSH